MKIFLKRSIFRITTYQKMQFSLIEKHTQNYRISLKRLKHILDSSTLCKKYLNSNLRLLVIVQSSNIISFSRDKCVYLKLRRFLIIIWVANFSSQTTRTQLFAVDFLWLPIFCDDYVTTENLCDDWTFLINISFPPKDQLCYWHWM